MPTDLRVGQTQAIGAASSDPPPPSDPARPRTGSTSVHQVVFTVLCSLEGSSSFKGTRVHIPAFPPQSPSIEPVPGGRCNAKGILGTGIWSQLPLRAYLRVVIINCTKDTRALALINLTESHQRERSEP